MAWYAELKRRQWYCIHGFNAISLYVKYLDETWWNSLTEDQKQHYHELKEKKRTRDREKLNAYLSFIDEISMCDNTCRRCYGSYQ